MRHLGRPGPVGDPGGRPDRFGAVPVAPLEGASEELRVRARNAWRDSATNDEGLHSVDDVIADGLLR
jgi:hypothetical protein